MFSFSFIDQQSQVPLIFCAHGTEFALGMSIAANGFASLSTLDSGFYGKGMYFTTHAKYTIPYCQNRVSHFLFWKT